MLACTRPGGAEDGTLDPRLRARGRGNSADHEAGSGDIWRNQADAEMVALMEKSRPGSTAAPPACSAQGTSRRATSEIVKTQKGVGRIVCRATHAEKSVSRLNGGILGNLDVKWNWGDWRGRSRAPPGLPVSGPQSGRYRAQADDRGMDITAEVSQLWARMPEGFARRGPDLVDRAAGGYTAQKTLKSRDRRSLHPAL
ncbi:hypothetical protein B0H10DRAFT_2378195 [Mycena sp. CBHHK59/15]|nr:hypothetical protein B0H10DRAFT_2378195 [Mycena sp. CBHHK59/15]